MSKCTTTKDIIPRMSISLGSILKDEFKARGIKKKDVAEAMGVPQYILKLILRAKVDITTEQAKKLERILGIPAGELLSFQTSYHIDKTRIAECSLK